MRKLILLLLIGSFGLFFSCNQPGTKEPPPPPPKEIVKDGVIIHIKHGQDDPQQAIMGLILADNFVDKKDVLVYLDVRAVHLATKDAPKIEFMGHSVNDALMNLINKKVQIMCCPGCMEAAGKTPDMLLDGISLRNDEDFFTFTKGKIITFDY
ncbi:MAG: hypothetical protein ACEPOW_07740 [Bacteroidales bacterium]